MAAGGFLPSPILSPIGTEITSPSLPPFLPIVLLYGERDDPSSPPFFCCRQPILSGVCSAVDRTPHLELVHNNPPPNSMTAIPSIAASARHRAFSLPFRPAHRVVPPGYSCLSAKRHSLCPLCLISDLLFRHAFLVTEKGRSLLFSVRSGVVVDIDVSFAFPSRTVYPCSFSRRPSRASDALASDEF